LVEACRVHDIAYSQYKDLADQHKADAVLINKAWGRVGSKNSKKGNKEKV